MMNWVPSEKAAELSYYEIVQHLNTDVQHGLTEVEAARRQRVHGFNDFDVKEDDPLWKKYLEQVSYSL
jgi:Ca2+-transporting ATPase